ncbi:2-keto-4-pentenoate hydratase [Marinobacter sp. F4216]|uniref:2-keto-4-pentenoate hydratase n=1 Tax=Marinobacter sp. F4216 TaxID=2874281 RepID=UPI001CBE955B|nr:fumarylacetoacetate hydrolase family protein [Marinobacter sp. F4216]MBZ2167438.1 fumarylacetoacetate hydrolase family protein [Marinobacter sp. F4216]
MPTSLDLHALALEVKAAQDSMRQIRPITDRLPAFDLSAAYEVANLIHDARLAEGARPVGRKIGFTNPDMWSKFGVREPIWAYIYDTTVVQLKDTIATCPLSNFAEPKIEPEIVLHFHSTPRAEGGLRGVLDAIDWVAHGFEIVQSHYPGWKFQAPDTVADWALHGTLLIGPALPLAKLGSDPVAALESFSLDLSCDGRHIETGKGSNVLGNPLAAIAHLVSVLAKQGNHAPLSAGEIVTTGTITTAQSIKEGETWRSELHGVAMPGLRVKFSA